MPRGCARANFDDAHTIDEPKMGVRLQYLSELQLAARKRLALTIEQQFAYG